MKSNIISFLKEKNITLMEGTSKWFNLGGNNFITIDWSDEIQGFQVTKSEFKTENTVITSINFWLDSNWNEIEVDSDDYPDLWIFPQSIDDIHHTFSGNS